MTSRCYFGKMNSIFGSVVPLAMFNSVSIDAKKNRESAEMEQTEITNMEIKICSVVGG